MSDGQDVVGMVTRNGRPLAGVLVSLCHPDRDPCQQMYTDTKGLFRFHAPVGDWDVEVFWASGFRSKPMARGGYMHFDLTEMSRPSEISTH
jgi:Protein of unknown function (DUF1416)